KDPPADGPLKLPALTAAELQALPIAGVEPRQQWQPPLHQTYHFADFTNNQLPPQAVQVGTVDLRTWPTHKFLPKTLPPYRLPGKDEQICAFVPGPCLKTGEWMTLRAIEWHDNRAVLQVDLWRDLEPRRQNLTW